MAHWVQRWFEPRHSDTSSFAPSFIVHRRFALCEEFVTGQEFTPET
jgi:hypothetical protein